MLQGWANFLLAEVTGSVALTGLIFKRISLNLARILSISQLPHIAGIDCDMRCCSKSTAEH